MNFYQKYRLKHVINASGKMTVLGVSKVSDTVLKAQQFGGQHFFEMAALSRNTGQMIAEWLAVEDAHIVASASAGIALSVAGIIGAGSLFHVHHPYDSSIQKREIILPKGHNVDYGAPVEVMVSLGGGKVIEAGYSNMCQAEHIAEMITPETAAILYVKSHHTVQKSMLSVSEAAEVAHAHQLPLIVDAAAEEDLRLYIEAGADIVIYSGAKAIEGPSSGLVIGKSPYVEWVRLQDRGIGRAMKIGKDNILGLTEAIAEYLNEGTESGQSLYARVEPFVVHLQSISPHVEAFIEKDGAGREIYRGTLKILPTSPLTAVEIVTQLKAGEPSIYTRDYQVNNGLISFDIRSVSAIDMEEIFKRLREILTA